MALTFTVEYVEFIHDEFLEVFWPGVEPVSSQEHRDRGAIDSALSAPFQRFGGRLLVRGIDARAARTFHGLIANHPFANGNKRTAILVLDQFYLLHGYVLALADEAMHDLAIATASYRARGLNPEQMVRQIEQTLEPFVVRDPEFLKKRKGLVRYRENLLGSPYCRDL